MGTFSVTENLQQLLLVQKDDGAVLLGIADEQGVTVLGCARCGATPADLQDVADVLPAPLALLGAFATSMETALQTAAEMLKFGFCASICVAVYVSDGQLVAARVKHDGSAGPPLETKQLPSLDQWLKDYRIFRCELAVRLEVVEDGTAPAGVPLQVATQTIVRQLEAPGLSYLAEAGPSGGGGKVLLRPDASGLVDSLPGPPASSGASSGGDVVRCAPLLDTTRLAGPPNGPVFTYQPLSAGGAAGGGGGGTATLLAAALRLDVLCYVRRRCGLGLAVGALTQGLVRQVRAAQRTLARQGKVLPVRAYHFLPPGLDYHLTVLYPSLAEDPDRNADLLVPARLRLHALLGLPPNRPLLRPANALDLAAADGGGDDGGGGGAGGAVGRLRDVHLGLATPGIGGSTALVQGSYEYCHYMQDRFNDSGWGCAYRSLQTICSWFRQNKYTSKPIPSHKTVQQVLARMGDKPPSFVGSSNWIGAIELSYILDDYLGVTSKFLTVNRGADIPSHARELAAHFANVGSPVMIGGGVLAYTLLGVRFNEQTGEAAFLILDPHYTGGEDLKKIQQGTWVGWKRAGDNAAAGGPLFVEDAFYNFLLPQRPNTV